MTKKQIQKKIKELEELQENSVNEPGLNDTLYYANEIARLKELLK